MAFKFDDYFFRRELRALELKKREAPLAAQSEPLEYQGLCVDCEVRKTCALEKPEGGVWRCEEYE